MALSLAGFGVLGDGLPVPDGVEGLVAGRADQPGRAAVLAEVLSPDGKQVLH